MDHQYKYDNITRDEFSNDVINKINNLSNIQQNILQMNNKQPYTQASIAEEYSQSDVQYHLHQNVPQEYQQITIMSSDNLCAGVAVTSVGTTSVKTFPPTVNEHPTSSQADNGISNTKSQSCFNSFGFVNIIIICQHAFTINYKLYIDIFTKPLQFESKYQSQHLKL